MSNYDALFAATAPTESVFSDKAALDPLGAPQEVIGRDDQEHRLATLLNGVHDGYLPTTVSVYGPPGTGKTLTTRRVCTAFADRTAEVSVDYVNLKDCRTLFGAANEIHQELTGTKLGAYEGLDGVFDGIWRALEDYPEWPILLLDEIDHIQHDTNYDPNDFFYRLLRGDGKLKRDLNLSVFLISNELLEVDLRLDSRVRSVMADEEVFFPPYDTGELEAILQPRVARAFHDDTLPEAVFRFGVQKAAARWGDARKALRLFRRAGETANDHGHNRVGKDCIRTNLDGTDAAAVVAKLTAVPTHHFRVLVAVTGLKRGDTVVQPITSAQMAELYAHTVTEEAAVSKRALRGIVNDLETMGLIETWVESRGHNGRVKQIQTTFDPAHIRDAIDRLNKER